MPNAERHLGFIVCQRTFMHCALMGPSAWGSGDLSRLIRLFKGLDEKNSPAAEMMTAIWQGNIINMRVPN